MVVPGDQVFDTIIAMVIAIFAFGLLAAYMPAAERPVSSTVPRLKMVGAVTPAHLDSYLVQVMPSEFGVQRPWHFPVTAPIKWCRRRNSKRTEEPAALDAVVVVRSHDPADAERHA